MWELSGDTIFATVATDGELLVLDGVAGLIWEKIDGATTDEIVARIAGVTAHDASTIAPDIASFLDDLAQKGLVTRG